LLGAGGAARAIAYGLHQRGAYVAIANRTADKATALAQEIGASTVSWSVLQSAQSTNDYDIVVNATTLGQSDSSAAASDLPIATLRTEQIAMDIVYKPVRTRWLAAVEAEARGIQTVHGGTMLLYQAIAQFELYTGKPAPIAAMQDAMKTMLGV